MIKICKTTTVHLFFHTNAVPFQLDARAARLGGRDEEGPALQRRVVCLVGELVGELVGFLVGWLMGWWGGCLDD